MTHGEAAEKVKKVVELIASKRVDTQMSLYRLSELTGLSREAIRLIEKGERSPTLHSLFLLSGALSLSLPEAILTADSR